MRLWHKDLIPVLPNKWLLAQWRELNAIIGKIDKCGTPNHPLVNVVMQFPITHFVYYANLVLKEMHDRGYVVRQSTYVKFVDLCNKNKDKFNNNIMLVLISDDNTYARWHNDRYFKQCCYNLQEKHDAGMITDAEWEQIERYIAKRGLKL